jgi:hypothetical protein
MVGPAEAWAAGAASAAFRNAQAGGMDFRLYNGGSANVTVGGVRVIRGNQ